MSELITVSSDELCVIIDPNRGNLITSLIAYGKEWIYLDQQNYQSSERPRCGCPVLFPYMGSLKDDTLLLSGTAFPAGIHGVVHTNQWEVIRKGPQAVQTKTVADSYSKQTFPFDFTLTADIAVLHHTLSYQVTIQNLSDQQMPCDIGFHPFLKLPIQQQDQLWLDEKPLLFDPQAYTQLTTSGSLHKQVHSVRCCEGTHQLTLRLKENLNNVFLWSGKPDQFLVIEPWSSVQNAINEGAQQFLIEPKASCKVAWELAFAVIAP